MPFGLTNAPATFQRYMNEILQPVLDKFALVYLDDVIIFSKTIEDHFWHISDIFDRLRNAGLKLKRSKCTFLKKQVTYLGHIVNEKGLSPDPEKQIAIQNYPIPENVDHLRSFLGLAGYYRRFVRNYAEKAHSLTKLTSKNIEWVWGPEQQEAFDLLKNCLITPPILAYPDFTRDFIVHTDASGYGVGSVLAQIHIDNDVEKEVVIAYASKHLDKTQANWSTIEKEAYAIIHAVKIFNPYLYGRRFQVLTDHRPLQWLMSIKEPTGKLARWALRLQEFDIEIAYRPGKTNQNADCLSRIPIPSDSNKEEPVPQIFLMTKEFIAEQASDEFCSQARRKFEKQRCKSEDKSINGQTQRPRPQHLLKKSLDNSDESDSDDDDFVELINGLIGYTGRKNLSTRIIAS
jgi:hypothetical protein